MDMPKEIIHCAGAKCETGVNRHGGVEIRTPTIMVIDDVAQNLSSAVFVIASVLNADYGTNINYRSLMEAAEEVWEGEPLITDDIILTHNHKDARAVLEKLKAEGKPLPTVVLSDNDTPETNNGIKWIKELATQGSPLKVLLLTGGDGVDQARQMKEAGHPNLIGANFGKITPTWLRTALEEVDRLEGTERATKSSITR